MVKELREKTSAPIMDCKNALSESNGNMELAIEWLRKKGSAMINKKAHRVAIEGLVGMKLSGNKGVMVQVNSETDFVARNELFQNFVSNITNVAFKLEKPDVDELLNSVVYRKGKVQELLADLVSKMQENIHISRISILQVPQGTIGGYCHNSPKNMLGRSAALVSLETSNLLENDQLSQLEEAARRLCMHIVAARPKYLSPECIPPEVVEKERAIMIEQLQSLKKPTAVLEKILEGKIKKFYDDVTLLNQFHLVEENDIRVHEYINRLAQNLQTQIVVKDFARFACGEEQL